jgi:chromosome segregation ATPase
MRLDLADSLQEIEAELAEVEETLEFSGIAEQMLHDSTDTTADDYPAIRRWLETVSNYQDLERDREELLAEREELTGALAYLEERLAGKRIT